MSINKIDVQVSEYLKGQNINYKVDYHIDNGAKKDWPCDLFGVSLGGVGFEFKTGLGHRQPSFKNRKSLQKLTGLNRVSFLTDGKINTKTGVSQAVAVVPTQASVLYSLLIDASASNESFNDWCDSLGYDSDSMSAFNIYQSCCNIGEKLKTIFNRKQLETLEQLLEEY